MWYIKKLLGNSNHLNCCNHETNIILFKTESIIVVSYLILF